MRMHQPSLTAVLAGILALAAGCGDSDSGTNEAEQPGGAQAAAGQAPDANGAASPGNQQPMPGATNAGMNGGAPTAGAMPNPGPAGPAENGNAAPPLGNETPDNPAAPNDGMSGPAAEPQAMQDPPGEIPAEMGAEGAETMDDPMAGMNPPPDEAEDPGNADDEAMPPDEMEDPAPMGDTFGEDIDGACTESQAANSNASGSGPYDVVVETNSDPGINEGTIFRPADLSGAEKFPIFVWGEGGCSQNGLSNAAAMGEIASHGYFVVADGTPNGNGSRSMNSNDIPSMGEPLLAYIDWAINENNKPCSAYYHALDQSKIASNGFSCGGLMSTGTSGDPRITTWGSTSSGTFSVDNALYGAVHTPVLIVSGGPSDIAYENGLRDYENISAAGHPIAYFSKDIGHGGDLFQGGSGDFTKINLAWLNWWLKGDESDSGKGLLVGANCPYCSDSAWETMAANLP